MAKKKAADTATSEVHVDTIDDSPLPAASVFAPGTALMKLLATLFPLLNGLEQGLQNLLRVVPEPREMHGAPLTVGVMTIDRDGKGVTLNAPKMKPIDIPFTAFAAMVERLHDAKFATVEIQGHSAGTSRQPAKSEILGMLNPFYSQITVYISDPGQRLRPDVPADKILRFYIPRHELTVHFLAAKLQQHGLLRLEEMTTQIAGWQTFAIPYAIDSLHNEQLAENLGEQR